jgi:hypothetical protein
MKTAYDVAAGSASRSEFPFAAGFASRSDSDFVGDRGERRPFSENGGQT